MGAYHCICVNGWAQPNCSVQVDECEAHYCQNDATCMVSVTEIERYREIEIDIDTERGRERESFSVRTG